MQCRWHSEEEKQKRPQARGHTESADAVSALASETYMVSLRSSLTSNKVTVPYSVRKQLTKLQSKMPLLVKASDHDLCPVQHICQFGVSLPIDSVPPCSWPWARSVIGRWTILFVHNIFKKVPCVLLRDGAANINPKLRVTICFSDADLKGSFRILHKTPYNTVRFCTI